MGPLFSCVFFLVKRVSLSPCYLVSMTHLLHPCPKKNNQVRLGFKLAAGLGEPWRWYGGTPQGCLLSMVLIVALYALV